MHPSVILEPAFALGFAACFVLIALAMAIFVLVGNRLFPDEPHQARPRAQAAERHPVERRRVTSAHPQRKATIRRRAANVAGYLGVTAFWSLFACTVWVQLP